jgi:hypothetical protein
MTDGPEPMTAEEWLETPFPLVNAEHAVEIDSLIGQFEAAHLIAHTEGPSQGLAQLSDSAGWVASRSIWIWFAAWAEQATSLGTPFTAVRIAEFTQVFHERFVPASTTEWTFLGKATDEQRLRIETAAFDACYQLDPDRTVRSDMHLPVEAFHAHLSERIGRPIEPRS